jgi:hypothetical protein
MTGARSSVMLMLPAACDSPTDLVDVNLDMWMYDVFCNTISNNPVQTVQLGQLRIQVFYCLPTLPNYNYHSFFYLKKKKTQNAL